MNHPETEHGTSGNVELVASLIPAGVDLVEVVNSNAPWEMLGGDAAAQVSPDVEVVFASPPSGGPPLTFEGAQGFVEGWRDWLEPFHSYRITPQEVIEAGDKVVVHAHVAARTERHGVDVEHRPSSVWTIKDGQIVAAHFFLDRDDALAFAGVA